MNVTFVNNRIRTRSGIFYAHMLPLMQRCAANGHTVHFVNFHPEPETEEVQKAVNGRTFHWNLRSSLAVLRHLQESRFLYCRNYGCALFALVARSVLRGDYRVHADLRGVVPEEVLRYRDPPFNRLLAFLARHAERLILRRSDSISCVSLPFRDYLLKRGGQPEKISVVPNGTDVSRYTFDPDLRAGMRRKLGLDDHLTYVFSGSPSRWSRPHEILELFKKIRSACGKARLLIITGHKPVFEKLCREAGIPDVLLYRLKAPEVPSYLMAGDYAFLLMEDDLVTRVAAPVKFAEYLAAGNKIILTPGIGDSSQLVQDHDAGVIVDPADLDKTVPQVTNPVPLAEKMRISRLAARYLDREKILSAFLHSVGL